jgi:DnaJ-domain-containing protein 1
VKLDSKIFDRIRIQPRHAPKPRPEVKICDWEGCERTATHRAPKGSRAMGEHFNFCLEHVRQYNQSFDFHAEQEKERDRINRAERGGGSEKPTWTFGTNGKGRGNPQPNRHKTRDYSGRRFSDPLHIFARYARVNQKGGNTKPERTLVEADRRALETLGFEHRPERDELKRAYKSLVKKHHPDANGGNRASEDRLRSVIAAYTYLKAKGFV